jgi:hypothetical protein
MNCRKVACDTRLTYIATTIVPTRYADVMRVAGPLARSALQRQLPWHDRNLG